MNYDTWKSTNPADNELGRSDGTPVRYRCASCDWRGKGSLARAQHWGDTAHVVLPADDPRFRLVSVCAWCPDSQERTAALKRQGKTVTHGICERCKENFEARR